MNTLKCGILLVLLLSSCKGDVNKPVFTLADIPVYQASESDLRGSTGMVNPLQDKTVEESFYLREFPAYFTRTGNKLIIKTEMTGQSSVFEDSGPADGGETFRMIDFLNESYVIVLRKKSDEYSYFLVDIISGRVIQTEDNTLSLAISPDKSRILYSYEKAGRSGIHLLLLKRNHEISEKWDYSVSDTIISQVKWRKDTAAVIAYAAEDNSIKYGMFSIHPDPISYLTIQGNQIWVRDTPSTGEVVMKLDDGTICEFLEQGPTQEIRGKTDYWIKISCYGNEGWVFGSQTSRQQEASSFEDYLALFSGSSKLQLPANLAGKYLKGMQGYTPLIYKKIRAYSSGTGADGTENIVWAYETVLKKTSSGLPAELLLAGYIYRDEEYYLDHCFTIYSDAESGEQPEFYFEEDQFVIDIPVSGDFGAYKRRFFFSEFGAMLSMPDLDEAITASTAQKLFELLDTLFEESAYTASTMGQQSMMEFESSLVSGENYSIVSFSNQECGAVCYGSNNSILCFFEDDRWTYRKDLRVLDDKNHIPGACMGIYPTTDPDYDLLLFEERIINHIVTTSITKRYYLYYKPGKNLRLLDLTAKTVEIMDPGLVAGDCENEEFKYAEDIEMNYRNLEGVKKTYLRVYETQNEETNPECVEVSKKLIREESYIWDENEMNFVLKEKKDF